MNTPFIAFVVVAIIGVGVLAVVGFDSSITGQPTLPVGTLRQFASAVPEKIESNPSPSKNTCACPDLYGNNIMTKQENSMFAGTSIVDCILAREIVKLKEDLKQDASGFDVFKNLCKTRGWW
jgi:hypothetical protein